VSGTGPRALFHPRSIALIRAVPEPVDLAYVLVPTDAVLPVLREGADLGIGTSWRS
jgi:acyl-CoA synthetase (NDP forming)